MKKIVAGAVIALTLATGVGTAGALADLGGGGTGSPEYKCYLFNTGRWICFPYGEF